MYWEFMTFVHGLAAGANLMAMVQAIRTREDWWGHAVMCLWMVCLGVVSMYA